MTEVTFDDVLEHRERGSWRQLDALAQKLVADANEKGGGSMNPLLGGGTRLMLALNHRISHDIDLFIRDPQWISFLSPRLNDRFEDAFDSYSETSVALKLRRKEGEIDFIVGMSLLNLPAETCADTAFALEPIAEVLAKKLFYRGWALTPRDLFDWHAIETMSPASLPHVELAKLLETRVDDISKALDALAVSAPARNLWAEIQAPALPELAETVVWAREELTRYRQLLTEQGNQPTSSFGSGMEP